MPKKPFRKIQSFGGKQSRVFIYFYSALKLVSITYILILTMITWRDMDRKDLDVYGTPYVIVDGKKQKVNIRRALQDLKVDVDI